MRRHAESVEWWLTRQSQCAAIFPTAARVYGSLVAPVLHLSAHIAILMTFSFSVQPQMYVAGGPFIPRNQPGPLDQAAAYAGKSGRPSPQMSANVRFQQWALLAVLIALHSSDMVMLQPSNSAVPNLALAGAAPADSAVPLSASPSPSASAASPSAASPQQQQSHQGRGANTNQNFMTQQQLHMYHQQQQMHLQQQQCVVFRPLDFFFFLLPNPTHR